MKNLFYLITGIVFFFSCKEKEQTKKNTDNIAKTLLDSVARHSASNALVGFETPPGYELMLFAAEPMIQNPTNMDIDHRGRVFITEAYNYRPQISGVKTKFEGDRIVILEDTNHDGKADESKVFYQGSEINAPLGICVLDNVVIVSQSPYVWKFTDTNRDDKADVKELLFQNIKGIQDDHGVHSFSLGPDGKYYFTMGNSSKTISDKNNTVVKTKNGDPIDENHFMQGLILRGNLDGSEFEVVGQNFRNNYECAIDAFGNIWQTDNDDDGNKGTRLNYILEYGKYGYKDENTHADWKAFRANIEDSIPLRHWHQNDPGVVPNLLQLGSGSPCGLMMYQGDLIPELKGSLLHAEALHHVIRAYTPSQNGATVTASNKDIVKQHEDDWFRPVDVTAAPDGSIFIADWYDPGVGGHFAGDQTKGRVYRLAPKNNRYTIKPIDLAKDEDLLSALNNPNLSARSLAQLKLRTKGTGVESVLSAVLDSNNETLKSRVLYILSDINKKYITIGLNDKSENIKLVALRIARAKNMVREALDILLTQSNSDQMWRECAIALRNMDSNQRPAYWQKIASKYTQPNRWFLEALGIGADGIWDKVTTEYITANALNLESAHVKDIIWRSRSAAVLPYLKSWVETSSGKEQEKYIRAFDFITSPSKNSILVSLLENIKDDHTTITLIRSLDPNTIKSNAKAIAKVNETMETSSLDTYIDLIEKFYTSTQKAKLVSLIKTDSIKASGKSRLGKVLVKSEGIQSLEKLYSTGTSSEKKAILGILGSISSAESIKILQSIIDKNESAEMVNEAFKQIGRGWNGEEYALKLYAQGRIPKEYLVSAMDGPLHGWRRPIRSKAMEILNMENDESLVYNISEMIKKSGSIENGKAVFVKNCSTCHVIGGLGTDFGPNLDEIGSKYGKDGLYTSIMEPSKAINFGYEGEQITTTIGAIVVGIKANETPNEITLKIIGGQKEIIAKKDIKERTRLSQSLMTAYLYKSLTEQELIDLVEFLNSLKKMNK